VIFAFSTSSPIVSVAVFSAEGEVLFSAESESRQEASNACLRLLEESRLDILQGRLFLADLGPGSFTGTRVGVTLAKTLAWAAKGDCGGATAFDLISVDKTVVFPSRRGEWFVRPPGGEVTRSETLPQSDYIGFGPSIENPMYPHAKRFASLLIHWSRMAPEALVPLYLIDPSISTPKQPLSRVGGQI
jgi:tRNA threonylcarbamoyladenosine biosynthesis protein TsaB